MNILVVGGTGMIGGHAALHLHSLGHKVTVCGRQPPQQVPKLAALPFLKGDYVAGTVTKQQLASFDAVIFTAGSDIRHIPENEDGDSYLLRANGTAVPAFARLAREAGVKQFIHVGSFYFHLFPELVETSAYVKSRKMASDGVVALATEGFSACSLDAPFVVGTVPGMDVPFFVALTRYAQGKLDIPPYAPSGGVAFISVRAQSEAIAGALKHREGVSGKAFVYGDENLSFETFFTMFFQALHLEARALASDQDHPILPRAGRYAGSRMAAVETTPEVYSLLGNYRRNDIYATVMEIVAQYK